MIEWIESAFINTSYEWQFTLPIESDWIRIRSSLYEYPVVYRNIWGLICQGTQRPLQKFQTQKIWQSQTQATIIYFPRPPLLLPSERCFGVLGQRFLKFKDPNASWVIHIDTPRIPINATLPDYTNPNGQALSESQIQALAQAIVLQQQNIQDTIDIQPIPLTLL